MFITSEKVKIMNAARVVDPVSHVTELLRLTLSSEQGLTVNLHTVGRRPTESDKEERLKGNLLSLKFIERGNMHMLGFEVIHPGSRSGGIRKYYQAADAETMRNLRVWAENTSVDDLKRTITKGKEVRPGLTFDRPHG